MVGFMNFVILFFTKESVYTMGKTLTGFHLKVIGVISMVFDHLLQFLVFRRA